MPTRPAPDRVKPHAAPPQRWLLYTCSRKSKIRLAAALLLPAVECLLIT